jgi:D-alanine-D-alanine ligase
MTTDDRIDLIVLFGGQSAEHDVSCTTAAHVLRAADPAKYRIVPIGISRDGRWSVATDVQRALASGSATLPGRLEANGEVVEPTAAITPSGQRTTVVMPLLHGPLGEDGTVQGMLELADLPYVGTGVLGSSLAMDKAMAKVVTAQHGIPQARHLAYRADQVRPTTAREIVDSLGLPVFVKPANMGSSVGVRKAKSVEAVREAIAHALTYDEWVIIEEAIVGREIEVAVLGNLEPRASVPGEIVPGAEFYDYDDKYVADGSRSLIPAPLTTQQTAEVQTLALRAFNVLRCAGLSRVDFFFEEHGRGFLLNEVNTMPGFTPISMYPKLWMASGLTYAELIDELVRLALERHTRRRRNTSHA